MREEEVLELLYRRTFTWGSRGIRPEELKGAEELIRHYAALGLVAEEGGALRMTRKGLAYYRHVVMRDSAN